MELPVAHLKLNPKPVNAMQMVCVLHKQCADDVSQATAVFLASPENASTNEEFSTSYRWLCISSQAVTSILESAGKHK